MRRIGRLPVVGIGAVGIALLVAAALAPSVSANRESCSVKNLTANGTYSTLQGAIDAAAAGAELRVKGTCVGHFVVGKDLTITGLNKNSVLDGDATGTVLTLTGPVHVVLNRLTITDGVGDGGRGGGIRMGASGLEPAQVLTLNASTVSGNTAADSGGGIYLASPSGGTLNINDSIVTANTTRGSGGGIGFGDAGVLNLTRSTLSSNTAASGGGWASLHGSLVCTESSLNGNSATGAGGAVLNDGHLVFNSCEVIGNRASLGGGIDGHVSGSPVFNGASVVAGNTATDRGGGIVSLDGTITLNDTTRVSGNSAGLGGGIFSSGEVVMNHTTAITENTATTDGGGIYSNRGVTLNDTSLVSANEATNGYGGGIFRNLDSPVSLNGGRVTGNTAALGGPDNMDIWPPLG